MQSENNKQSMKKLDDLQQGGNATARSAKSPVKSKRNTKGKRSISPSGEETCTKPNMDYSAPELLKANMCTPLPVDNLLEHAYTFWQFGDWDSLAKIERDAMQQHPDRAQLALLASAGHLQTNNVDAAKQFIHLAKSWGCSKKLISQILVAGVHSSLGRAAAIMGQQLRALQHFEYAIAIGAPDSIAAVLVRQCLESDDVYDAIDNVVATNNMPSHELFIFYLGLADQFILRKDTVTALHFLETTRDQIDTTDDALLTVLVQKFVAIGKADLATDIVVKATLHKEGGIHLNSKDKAAIQSAYDKGRAVAQTKSAHGHDLLLQYLLSHIQEIKTVAAGARPVVIEIGTTRENLSSQGSTREIAEFCKKNALHFITVDMDPHNTRMAAEMFKKLGTEFHAITMKGEDYLRNYKGNMDFVFLDAYDFDHGQHSELRQSRYKKYLGNPIDEAACHQMHFDCAESVLAKLSPNGLVCIDDTWLVDGKWSAKGTLAMPFLLEHGFKLLEACNRAALLARDATSGTFETVGTGKAVNLINN